MSVRGVCLDLTSREREVLQCLADGLSNKLIGARLGCTYHTAKFHMGNIHYKLGTSTPAGAVGTGFRLGLVT